MTNVFLIFIFFSNSNCYFVFLLHFQLALPKLEPKLWKLKVVYGSWNKFLNFVWGLDSTFVRNVGKHCIFSMKRIIEIWHMVPSYHKYYEKGIFFFKIHLNSLNLLGKWVQQLVSIIKIKRDGIAMWRRNCYVKLLLEVHQWCHLQE